MMWKLCRSSSAHAWLLSTCFRAQVTCFRLVLFMVVLVNLLLPAECRDPPCKPGFSRVGRWCFSVHTDPASRNQSLAVCQQTGGSMVVLDSAEKEQALTSYITENDLLSMTDQRLELYKDLEVLMNGDDEMEKFCEDYLKFGTQSKTYRHFINNKIPIGSAPEERANLTTPPGFKVALSSIPGAGMGAWTEIPLSKFTVLGSYEGLVRPDINEKDPYSWVVGKLKGNGSYVIDALPLDCSNWLRYVNAPRNFREENAQAVPCAGLVFYMTIKEVPPGSELLVWYGDNYGLHLNVSRVHPEHDLNATVVFRINVIHIRDSLGEELVFEDGTPLVYENWLEDASYTVVDKSFGLLLSYDLRRDRWKWLPERNYSYFTGREGLYLPFVCEDRESEIPDG
ncbi:histone-lysine N-methyltransferase PRDM7-like [Crassostrea virginica]